MWRSVWAVVAGFLFIGVFAVGSGKVMHSMYPALFNADGGTSNTALLLITTVCVGVFAVVGSYLTARLAPMNPMRHAIVLGGLGLVFNLISVSMTWSLFPAWYNVLNLALVVPYAWFGGRLRENEIGSVPMLARV